MRCREPSAHISSAIPAESERAAQHGATMSSCSAVCLQGKSMWRVAREGGKNPPPCSDEAGRGYLGLTQQGQRLGCGYSWRRGWLGVICSSQARCNAPKGCTRLPRMVIPPGANIHRSCLCSSTAEKLCCSNQRGNSPSEALNASHL